MNSLGTTQPTPNGGSPRRRWLFVGVTVVLFTAIYGALAADDEDKSFRFATKREGDELRVVRENGATVFDVRSKTGIGEATIERKDESWPDKMVVRLHLAGLENFTIKSGDQTINVAVSSNMEFRSLRQWLGAREQQWLDRRSPLWIELRAIDAEGRPSENLPLKGGYFELRLPAALTTKNLRTLQLTWIDFYR